MSLLTNPLLLATLTVIMTLSSTQEQGPRERDTHTHHLTPPLLTTNRHGDLLTCGGAERERWEGWKGWGKG